MVKKKKLDLKISQKTNLDNSNNLKSRIYFKSSEKMTEIADNTIDLIITSPPYFNIKDYSKNGTQDLTHSSLHKQDIGNMNNYSDYIKSLLKVWKECERVLKPNGKLCINVPPLPMLKEKVNTHHNRTIYDLQSDIQNSILKSKNTSLYLYDLYIWKRTNSQKRLMFGSYPYPRNFYNNNICEFITVYVKDGKPNNNIPLEIKEKSRLTEKEWLEYTQQVWEIPSPNKSDSAYGQHPSIMPAEIVKRLVRLFTFEGDAVLDPFAGSGTTLKIAQELNRKWVGYEIYKNYELVIKTKLREKKAKKELRFNQIYNLDVFKFLDNLEEESIDLAIIDPPYNRLTAEWDQFENETEFFNFTYQWIDKLIPKLKRTASIYMFNTPQNCTQIMSYLIEKKLIFQNWITWYKKDGFNGNKKKYVNNQETILFFTVSDNYTFNYDEIRVPYTAPERVNSPKGILKNGKRWFPNPNGKLCPDVWEISSNRHQTKIRGKIKKNIHPSPKPEEMIERMIKASSNKGDLVLDLFSGTGTTSAVAKKLKRVFVGCELNELYYKNATSRIDKIELTIN